MLIKEVMSSPAICVDYKISIKEAVEIMENKNLGFLPVTKNGYLIGVITDRDLIIRGKNLDLNSPISNIITRDVITINLNEPLLEAAKLMSEHKIRRLVVVDDQLVKGVITSKELLHDDYLIPYIKETYNIYYY